MNAHLQLHHLVIGYGRHRVAGPIDASLPAGTLTCLLGRNGSGKSTLLRTLAALQSPISGEVIFSEYSELSGSSSSAVGIVLTHRLDGIRLTVSETVALGRMPHTGFLGRLNDDDRRVVEWAMQQTAVIGLASRQVQTLSDGEWQRVMLARVLAQQTPVILADEVTAFLDYPSKREVMKLLRQVAHSLGLTVLLSTHDVPLALEEADRLWLLSDGHLSEGTPTELAKTVERSFN